MTDVVVIEGEDTLIVSDLSTDVVEVVEETIVVTTETSVDVITDAEQGPRGIQGIPGPAGGATYTHTQATPAAVWTVAHNLGRWPSVAVTDHLGNLIEPDVKYLDSNIVQVTHGAPFIGVAYCN